MSNWTPGPWAYKNTLDYDGDLHEWISCPDGDTPWRCETSPDRTPEASRANHELIALAPEMAEAILDLDKWDCNCDQPYGYDHGTKLDCVGLRELADKLRAIGTTNE